VYLSSKTWGSNLIDFLEARAIDLNLSRQNLLFATTRFDNISIPDSLSLFNHLSGLLSDSRYFVAGKRARRTKDRVVPSMRFLKNSYTVGRTESEGAIRKRNETAGGAAFVRIRLKSRPEGAGPLMSINF